MVALLITYNYPLKDRLGDQTLFMFVLIAAIKITEGRTYLTYAQFPISFANIFRGIVLGSSFSFPSVSRLCVGEKQRKEVNVKIKIAFG